MTCRIDTPAEDRNAPMGRGGWGGGGGGGGEGLHVVGGTWVSYPFSVLFLCAYRGPRPFGVGAGWPRPNTLADFAHHLATFDHRFKCVLNVLTGT